MAQQRTYYHALAQSCPSINLYIYISSRREYIRTPFFSTPLRESILTSGNWFAIKGVMHIYFIYERGLSFYICIIYILIGLTLSFRVKVLVVEASVWIIAGEINKWCIY